MILKHEITDYCAKNRYYVRFTVATTRKKYLFWGEPVAFSEDIYYGSGTTWQHWVTGRSVTGWRRIWFSDCYIILLRAGVFNHKVYQA